MRGVLQSTCIGCTRERIAKIPVITGNTATYSCGGYRENSTLARSGHTKVYYRKWINGNVLVNRVSATHVGPCQQTYCVIAYRWKGIGKTGCCCGVGISTSKIPGITQGTAI